MGTATEKQEQYRADLANVSSLLGRGAGDKSPQTAMRKMSGGPAVPGKMHPIMLAFRAALEENPMTKGVGITDALRTRAQQEDLFRRKPGLAAKPGTSPHEFGMAYDLKGSPEQLAAAAELGKALGIDWGGNFQKVKEPWHFQLAKALRG